HSLARGSSLVAPQAREQQKPPRPSPSPRLPVKSGTRDEPSGRQQPETCRGSAPVSATEVSASGAAVWQPPSSLNAEGFRDGDGVAGEGGDFGGAEEARDAATDGRAGEIAGDLRVGGATARHEGDRNFAAAGWAVGRLAALCVAGGSRERGDGGGFV